MFFRFTIAVIFCICAVNAQNLKKCSGPSSDSQDDFQYKYDTAQIVAFGKVDVVRNNKVKFTVSCTLKGDLLVPTLELEQLQEVLNTTECHYLTANKQYVVFLESTKVSSRTIYRLADMEEIEITSNTVKNFLDEECADNDDFDIEMTMWYYNNNLKCNQFNAICNQTTRNSILNLNYSPLTQNTTLLGGYKKTVSAPSVSDNEISGKQGGGADDDDSDNRNAATNVSFWMPIIIFLTALVMKLNF